MDVFHEKEALQSFLKEERGNDKTIGLVPTMGALHKGHLSLVRNSASENDVTVVSVFVNPTQFDNPDDLEKYPRKLETDLDLLKDISKDIVVFAPSVSEMYGEKVIS